MRPWEPPSLVGKLEREALLSLGPHSRRRRRIAIAATSALAIHAAFLAVMGLEVARGPPLLERSDTGPAVELTLVSGSTVAARPAAITPATRAARLAPRAPSPLAGLAAPPAIAAAPAAPSPPAPPGPAASYPGFFVGGLLGCGREDIDLLTPSERVRCRDAIETERARRAEAYADADRARRLQDALSRTLDGIAPHKRAYYDAVQGAKAAVASGYPVYPVRPQPMAGARTNIDVGVHVGCTKALGAGAGPLKCPLKPPPGFLTEEARISPP